MPRGSRLCWLDSSGYIHSKISYMVSSLRGERGEGGKREIEKEWGGKKLSPEEKNKCYLTNASNLPFFSMSQAS